MGSDYVVNVEGEEVTKESAYTPQAYNSLYSDQINAQGDKLLLPPSKPKSGPLATLQGDNTYIVMDIEATGLNPWEYRVIVVGLWDLAEGPDQIQSFWGLNEEDNITRAIDWLNEKEPTHLIVYNGGYDERALLTRAMFYQLPMPWYPACKHVDMMDILKKGAPSGVVSSQPAGGVEDWEKYFWEITKPFTIEECFEGLMNGDEGKNFMLRNKSCCHGEGELFKLYMFATGQISDVMETMPPVAERDEGAERGEVGIPCPVCKYVQEFDLENAFQTCIVCGAQIPNPDPKTWLKEVIRPLDDSAIAAASTSGKASAAAKKKATSKKKA